MKKFKIIAFFAVIFSVLAGFGTQASASSSPSLKVNNVYTTSKSVSGTATKGVSIIVRTPSKKVLTTTTANSQTGKFSAPLHTSVKANQKLYVYARKSSTSYFYRIMIVKAAKSAATTSSTTSTSKSSSSNKITIGEPTGTWKSGNNNGYTVVTKFSQAGGLNQGLYKNGQFQKKLINYANYKVTTYSESFWGITYRQRGHKNYEKFYLRFTDNTHFIIVNKSNKAVKVQYGNSPVHYYKFGLEK
ncbi:peptidase [Lentilactobacillus sp. IMAU92037]|uniref:Ig-like domain-containing protein n=1 Tax=Lentilactobacillus dabitei TaxID=2831523 RepID=UPI001C2BCE96|nr:Ig-like domain-containing protein [Lentilactobacillus dabitei]MBV0930917.1 peptidase [Lentilactobacillus dabitei]